MRRQATRSGGKMQTRAWVSTVAVLVPLIGFAPRASANTIAPNTSGAPDVFGALVGVPVAGGDTGVLPYTAMSVTGTVFFSGTYESRVFTDNSICPGCLDFVYNFTNSPTSPDTIHRATV